jgi:hypothetical protein
LFRVILFFSALTLLYIIELKKAGGVILILQMANMRCWEAKNKWFRDVSFIFSYNTS